MSEEMKKVLFSHANDGRWRRNGPIARPVSKADVDPRMAAGLQRGSLTQQGAIGAPIHTVGF